MSSIPKSHFDGIEIELSNPLAIIDLLDVSAIDIKLKTINNLLNLVQAYPFMIIKLIDTELLNKLKELIIDDNIDVRVYSLELMAQLSLNENVNSILTADKDLVEEVISITHTGIGTNSSLALQEHSLNCVYNWCYQNEDICLMITELCDQAVLLSYLKLEDPDIQSYVLQIMYKLLTDPDTTDFIASYPELEFTRFFNLLRSEYPHIQHCSMKIIKWFADSQEKKFLPLLLENGVLKEMIYIFEMYGWIDLHDKAFEVLVSLARSRKVSEQFGVEGLEKLLFYIKETEFQHLEGKVFSAIVEFLKINPSRRFLIGMDIVETLFFIFHEGNKEMVKLAIDGFGLTANETEGIEQLEVFPGLILELFNIISDNEELMPNRISSACTIQNLIKRGFVFPQTVMDYNKWKILIHFLQNYPYTIPLEMALPIASAINNLLLNEANQYIVDDSLVETIIRCLKGTESETDELKQILLYILQSISCSGLSKNWLTNPIQCRNLIYCLYDIEGKPVLVKSMCQLFINLVKSEQDFEIMLFETDGLDWLIKQKDRCKPITEVDALIKAIYKKCSYIKFYYCDRLEMTDFIKSGFIFTRGRRQENARLKTLDILLKEKKQSDRPVFLVNFSTDPLISQSQRNESDSFKLLDYSFSFKTDDDEQDSSTMSENFETEMTDDSVLRLHVRKIKSILGYSPSEEIPMDYRLLLDKEYFIEKLKVLAEFVCEVLNGGVEETVCRNFEVNVANIKHETGTNVIPIGNLKYGTKLEKALLFKSLGDQVSIPSAIERTSHAIAWIEVYLEPGENLECDEDQFIPVNCNLIKTNHLVDLDKNPGALYPLGSQQAIEYIGIFNKTATRQKKTSRIRPRFSQK